MTETLSGSNPPPGSRRRAVSRFKRGIARAVIAELVAVIVTLTTWAGLRAFDRSLKIDAPGPQIALALEIALGVAALIVPAYGARAVVRSRRASRLAREGRILDARTAAEDARDDLLYVIGFGLVAAIVAFGAFFLSAHQGRVRAVMFKWDVIWSSRTALIRGFWWNVKLFVVAEAIVLVWALVVAVVRQLPGRAFLPLRTLAIVYADVFRGIPTIIVIYLVGFGFPLAGIEPFATHMSGNTQLFWLGIVSLSLVYGAYVAEVYRSGLESIHWSQTAAARSLGLSQWQTLRHVVVPQAVRRILPPLLNDFVALQKDTALVSIIGLSEILLVGTIIKSNKFNLSPITGAAIFFLVVTLPFTRLVDYLIKRDKERTQGG
ncbi:MAG: polar amino acid transport system permease protein [Actinomycetota bacterium]|nr:polar amino acid transport system permease protein [Actinomycetota bacterium]